MSTPLLIIVAVLFIGSAILIVINITGDPGIDYWDLDGQNRQPRSSLDFLRNKPIFYCAGVVLVASFLAYILTRSS
ncbi:hypothetical protein SAMN05443245_1093 [Paraburkholderia fungorum]|uniref:Uncharacterized protein n=1 Tax=Paraburkholderia fungorum TaxID=134537 RepID=A0A1H1A9P3_9BURK|nr:hypothetical protein SAMN05443245_1093 [Paraburkholderia fungorum]